MKSLIVHRNGKIVFTMQGTNIEDEYKCLVEDIEENKEIVSVDVETNTVITKDKEQTIEEQNEILVDKVIELTAENCLLKEE